MNSTIKNILFFVILLFIIAGIIILSFCCCQHLEILKDILIGFFSSVLLLLIFEIRNYLKEYYTFGYLEGSYKRINIFEIDPAVTSDSIYRSLNEQYNNVPSEIILKYTGDRQYKCKVHYKEGETKATFFINSTNNKIGKGNYQYTTKHNKNNASMPDFGNYELQVDEMNNHLLYVFHKNILPSGLASGYETWEKQ